MPVTDELRRKLSETVGLNWETLQTSIREAAIPQPPYKEPLMYLIYLTPEIPWRQCGRVAERLWKIPDLREEAEAGQLADNLARAHLAHRPYFL